MAKQEASAFAIDPEPNKIHDNFLNIVGTAFKFDHPKGLAEWLKNSADAYATSGIRDDEQFIVLRFELRQPKSKSVFECVDFVGCTKADIDEAVKIWGSPTAAKKGTEVATFGGHGNGGKFYMRQMFATAKIITYRHGVLNIFGFDHQHRYGFARGYKDKKLSLSEALKLAQIDDLDIPKKVLARWKKSPNKAGFTVVRGEHPFRFSGRSTISSILEGLRYHPQARRLLQRKQIILVNKGHSWGDRLTPPEIAPKPGFEKPREISVPRVLIADEEEIPTRTKQHPSAPKLILRTSAEPLSRSRELATMNTIDIMGEVGCIGSYRLNEMGFRRFLPENDFIYGECECPFLEEKGMDCVSNDREKLVPNDLTNALLEWICEQVEALALEIGEKRREEKKTQDLAQSSLFNQMLDKWKNKFMARLNEQLFGGSGLGDAFGGSGGGHGGGGDGSGTPDAPGGSGQFPDFSGAGAGSGGDGDFGEGIKGGDGAGTGSGGTGPQGTGGGGDGAGNSGGTGEKKKSVNKFPTVLLSGYDPDPLDPEATAPFDCDPRHPPVHQRSVDVAHGIYWINTSRPLAGKVLERYGAGSARWREYLFQRYVDIIIKQQVYNVAKRDAQFSPERVDELIDKVTSTVHDAAAEDLEQFLFADDMTGAPAAASAAS